MTNGDDNSPFVSPNFSEPPLLEVALAVEFLPIANFGAMAMGDLARSWSDRYPLVEEHPPLPPAPALGGPSTGVMVSVGAPQIRLWLLTESRARLVQIQRDRLVVNWRATDDEGDYPRYDGALRPEFVNDLQEFTSFTARRGSAPLQISAAEVTYVNMIAASARPDFVDTLRSQQSVDHHLGRPASCHISQTWNRHQDDRPDGTVTVNADSGGGHYMLTISARSVVAPANDLDAVLLSLDSAHADVVATFTEVTTEQAQCDWGRTS